MNDTDQMIDTTPADQLETEAAVTIETKPEKKPARRTFKFIPSAVLSGIKSRLTFKKNKATNFLKALDFANTLVNNLGMRRRSAVLSVQKQYNLTTREARMAVRDARKRKPRRRS